MPARTNTEAYRNVLPAMGIRLTPDPKRKFLVAETKMETPFSLATGGLWEIKVVGAGFDRELSKRIKLINRHRASTPISGQIHHA
jgi:hypothetical protein